MEEALDSDEDAHAADDDGDDSDVDEPIATSRGYQGKYSLPPPTKKI